MVSLCVRQLWTFMRAHHPQAWTERTASQIGVGHRDRERCLVGHHILLKLRGELLSTPGLELTG